MHDEIIAAFPELHLASLNAKMTAHRLALEIDDACTLKAYFESGFGVPFLALREMVEDLMTIVLGSA